MKQFVFILFGFFLFSPLHPALCLKCRTGNQQSDDQFQKIMQVCRRRYLGYERENGRDYNSRDTDSQESDSDSEEDMFDKKFLTSSSSNNRYNKNDNSDNNRYDYSSSSSSSRGTNYQYSNRNNWNNNYRPSNYNSSRSSYDNNSQMNYNNRKNARTNSMDSHGYNNDAATSSSDNYYNRYRNNRNNDYNRYNSNNNNNYYMNRNNRNYNNNNNNNNNNDNNNNDEEHGQACIVQCFFNELNLVDQRGFPEKSSVINIMTQNIQDPELQDFVEESVIECYHYLINNNSRQEKCQFSSNLLSCLAEKGSERCEDWDDD